MSAPAQAARSAPNPFMSSDKPSCPPPVTDVSINEGSNDAPTAAVGDALSAWSSLIDGWWRQQSETLPDELRHTMDTMLDQSKAMVSLACGLSEAKSGRAENDGTDGAPADPTIGLWRPILDALQACEASVLTGRADAAPSEEYAAAAGAYLGEFAHLNVEVTRRIRGKLDHLDADVGFVDLHRLILEEAEEAYLAHVSSDAFAGCQAQYINALLRLAQSSRRVEEVSPEENRKA